MLRVRPSKDNSKVCVMDGKGRLQELKSEVIENGFLELNGSNIHIDFGRVNIPNSYASIQYTRDAFGRLLKARIVIDRSCRGFCSKALSALIAHELSHLIVGKNELKASIEAIRRGFRSCFEELFAEVCRVPCGRIYQTEWIITLEYRQINIGGLNCLEFCPYNPSTRGCARTQ